MKNGDAVFGVVTALIVIIHFVITYPRKKIQNIKLVEKKVLKVNNLTSRNFLLNILYLIGFFGLMIITRNLIINAWLGIIVLMLVWIPLFYFCYNPLQSVKKITLTEPKNLHIVKIKKYDKWCLIISGIVTILLSEQIIKIFGDNFQYSIWFMTYVICYNILGWYYFRKNEKAVAKQSVDKIE